MKLGFILELMCGICGVVYSDPGKPVERETLRRMTDIMSHRGPDNNGFYIASGIGLGIRRLSIIDLHTGDQPISNEDGTITVVCNGEIYNFKELRQELTAAGHRFKTNTDVEVIVHLYEDYGVHCVDYLRGMFGFALWDARNRRLMLSRDRLGIKHLHYSLESVGLFFGSELKSILISGTIERQLDVSAIEDLFAVGFVLAPKTLFSRIRRLEPGHYLLFQNGSLSIHKYWDLQFPVQEEFIPQRSEEEWSESLKAKLEESVRIHLRSDVPVGTWLSAGIDSSAVTAMMSRLTQNSVRTFSLAFEDPQYDEVSHQQILKDFAEYNLSHEQTVCTKDDLELFLKAIWHCEDPFPAGAAIPRMLLSQLASRYVKVVLVGEGSDEVLGGYPWFRTYKLLNALRKLPFPLRRFLARLPIVKKKSPRVSRLLIAPNQLNLSTYKQIINYSHWDFDDRIFSDDLNERRSKNDQEDIGVHPPEGYDRWNPFIQLQYFEIKIRLADYITRNLDATSMAYSLEARVPFLDHPFVEFCAQIPPALKMRWLKEKYILRRAMQDVLPTKIVWRKKRGLAMPYAKWLRILPEFIKHSLSEEQLRKKGYFNPRYVRRILEQHRTGTANYERQIVSILGVQLWDELFLHGCKP